MTRADGQALVEFALVLPLLLVFAFGILLMAEIGVARVTLEHAASEGARSPGLTCHGTAIDWLDATRVRLTGTLTLDELTSDVELDTIYEGRSVDADGTPRATFRAETPLGAERSGLGWEALLEGDPLNDNDRLILAISAILAASR